MALSMAQHIFSALPELRVHPSPKRIRALVGTDPVVDTTRALLVWEPRRVVPSYAVPVADIHAELTPARVGVTAENPVRMGDSTPVLDPGTGFGAHSGPGTTFTVETPKRSLTAAAFTPDDPELEGFAVLDFDAFDAWLEEDDPVVGHARDPFTRIDTRHSSRHVVIELDGVTLADSHGPTLLFETYLPTRYYLRRDDVRTDLLGVAAKLTTCAYKGHALHFDALVGDTRHASVAWTYEEPLLDAVPVRGMIAFYNERVDITVDGTPLDRPQTPWSE